jgi:hypothetical protein
MTTSANAPGTPGYNPAWYSLVQIFIDPQNVSGTASNSNNGTTSATAISTWAEAVRRWGSVAPQIAVSLAITFLSSHVDDTDPVVWNPIINASAQLSIWGTVPASVAAVFTLNTAKNHAVGTNAVLTGSFSAGAPTAGKLIQNTTATKSSRAWICATDGGANWIISQPLALGAVGTGVPQAEVNSWTSADTVNVLTPVAVNVVQVAPVSDTGNKTLTLYQLTIFDPGGAGTNPCVLSGNVETIECSSQRNIIWSDAPTAELQYASNHLYLGNLFSYTGSPTMLAGATMGTGTTYLVSSGGAFFDGDHIIGANTTLAGTQMIFGLVALLNGISVAAGTLTQEPFFYGSSVIYGTGGNNINLQSYTRLTQGTGGTFVAAFTAPALVTGILLNGAATGQSHTGATPDVIASAITTTPAHLDATAGPAGFGGTAFNMGGASVSKVLD